MLPDEGLAAAAAVQRGVTRLSRRLRLECPEPGETLLELSVLGHLSWRGPMTPGELAAADRVQPQSLTRTLARLESGRLVRREAHPRDGRRSVLALTQGGRDALRRDIRQRDGWLAAAMASQLTATECELLRLAAGLLDRLADAPLTTSLRDPR